MGQFSFASLRKFHHGTAECPFSSNREKGRRRIHFLAKRINWNRREEQRLKQEFLWTFQFWHETRSISIWSDDKGKSVCVCVRVAREESISNLDAEKEKHVGLAGCVSTTAARVEWPSSKWQQSRSPLLKGRSMKAHPSKSNCRNSRRLDFPGGLQYETATHTGDALKDHWNLLYMHTLTPGGKFVPFSTPPIDRLAAARCTCPSPKMQHYTSLERLYYAHHNIQPLQMWPLIHSRNSIQQHFFLQIFSFIGGASNNNQLGTVYIIGGSEMRGGKTKRPSNTRFYMTPSPFFPPFGPGLSMSLHCRWCPTSS